MTPKSYCEFRRHHTSLTRNEGLCLVEVVRRENKDGAVFITEVKDG